MRLISTLLSILILACLLMAPAPIGFGPGTLSIGLLDLFDWYGATSSGCTPGARGMCAGSGGPYGDTLYFSLATSERTISSNLAGKLFRALLVPSATLSQGANK